MAGIDPIGISNAMRISRVSARALLLGIYGEHSETLVATGTGFIAQSPIGACLVTARHCLTGRDHFTGVLNSDAACPTRVRIFHRLLSGTGGFSNGTLIVEEALLRSDGSPRWYEDWQFGDLCDYAILPLTQIDNIALHPVATQPGLIELTRPEECHIQVRDGFVQESHLTLGLQVADLISVVGYPFGAFTGSMLPLWTTGHISSEPEIPTGFGIQYIDCRARPGQSGSPVYVRRVGEIPLQDGQKALISGIMYSFVGLYSGRINSESDIGLVWKTERIHETLRRLAIQATANEPRERPAGSAISRLARGQ